MAPRTSLKGSPRWFQAALLGAVMLAAPAAAQTTIGPGVAGVANPSTFSASAAPGIAGNAALATGAIGAATQPGVAGIADPVFGSATSRPGITGAAPLLSGLTFITVPAVPSTPDPNTFSAIQRAGIAGNGSLISPAVTTTDGSRSRLVAPVDGTTQTSSTAGIIVAPGFTDAPRTSVSGIAGGAIVGRVGMPSLSSGVTITNGGGRVRAVGR